METQPAQRQPTQREFAERALQLKQAAVASSQGSAGPQSPDEDCYLPARKVWERYGVTDQSIYRWVRDTEMNFPKAVYFGRFRYWRNL